MAASAPAKLTIALFLAFVAVASVAITRAVADAPPHTGAPAPAFSLPVVANGTGTVSLSSLKGHAVYLNFFASWCQPCKEEVPYIGTLSKQYAHHNVVVVGVDELEAADKAKQFAVQYHLPYRVALDNSGEVGGSYGLVGLPLHVFIAPNGTVVAYRVGELSESQIRNELQTLSAEHH